MTNFWVMLGSALGCAPYFMSGLAAEHIDGTFPFGALIVNLTGSFLIGFFAPLTAPDARDFGQTRRGKRAQSAQGNLT